MALALNSSHPLFGNIVAFVCPNEANNAIVDLKVPSRVITPTGGTFTFGSGAYGRSINAPATSGSHLALSPVLLDGNRVTANYTVIAIVNNTAALSGGGANQPQFFAYGSASESMTIDKTGGFLAYSPNPGQVPTLVTDADVLAAGAYSAAYTYSGASSGNAVTLYHNGVLKGSGSPTNSNATINISAFHSKQAFTWHTTEYAYLIAFDKVLTLTEISDLHASLGANNQFALLDSAPVVTPISFTGNIANQTFTAGDVVNVDLATGNYAGTETPFTYANVGTALTGTGLSISSAGVLSGTATQATVTGVIMRGTDAATNTADSNAFSVTVNAPAAQVPQGTVTIGTITKTDTTASVPYTYNDTDQTGFEYRIDGGAAVTASASPISLTGLTQSTAYTIEVRAINGAGAGTWSAVGNFTTDAAPVTDATIVFGADTALSFNTGSLRANLTGLSVDIYDVTTRALVLSVAGHTTDANAVMANIQNAALTAATEYRIVVLGADGSEAVFRENSQ